MANYLNRPSIFEIATAFEDGQEGEIKQKTKTNVVVNTTRIGYGKKSTVSKFIARAYDETGNKVDSIKGYFLEPETDYNRAKIKNSDTLIAQGNYKVIPKKILEERINTERRKRGETDIQLTYQWYVWQCHYDQAHCLHTIDKLIEYLFPLFFFFLRLSFLPILS